MIFKVNIIPYYKIIYIYMTASCHEIMNLTQNHP